MSVTALVVPVSGPYTATWKAFSLGTQNDDGFVLTAQYNGQEVNLSDAYGMTLVEAIFRGVNWRMRFRGLEWNKAGILAVIQTFGSTGAPSTTFTPEIGLNIGSTYSFYAQPLVLTALLSMTSPGPNTLTALGAVIAPNSNTEIMMTSKVREAPLEMMLIPYNATVGSLSNIPVAFTTT